MDVIMVGPWMPSSQNGLNHGLSIRVGPRMLSSLVSSNMDENLVKYITKFLSWRGEQRLPANIPRHYTPFPKKTHIHTTSWPMFAKIVVIVV